MSPLSSTRLRQELTKYLSFSHALVGPILDFLDKCSAPVDEPLGVNKFRICVKRNLLPGDNAKQCTTRVASGASPESGARSWDDDEESTFSEPVWVGIG